MANHNPVVKFSAESARLANGSRWSNQPWCVDCSDTHSPERRQKILERLGDVTPADVHDQLGDQVPHLWHTKRGLEKDLAIVRKRNGWSDHQPKRYADAECSLIVSLYRLGYSPSRIGARLTPRRTRHAIYRFLYKRGFTNEHRKTGRDGKAHPWGGR